MELSRLAKWCVVGVVGCAVLAVGANLTSARYATPSEHERIVNFWTNERLTQAKPRDFVVDRKSRQFRPLVKPSTDTGVTGASWLGGGDVVATTGRVFFSMNGSYYLCSGSVVEDSRNDRSLVLTAGHCAYDEVNGAFAENWLFVPDYDSAPVSPTRDRTFCDNTSLGCWTATALVVSNEYATAGSFNDQAVLHDYAYAVVEEGGRDDVHLDTVVAGQGIRFDAVPSASDTWLFGLPAAQRYKGIDLVYCRNPLGFDPYMANQTYRVKCNMTGGSSGGPWFVPFSTIDGRGTIMSVNSYGYSGIKAMHGPKLGTEASAMFEQAEDAVGNILHVGG